MPVATLARWLVDVPLARSASVAAKGSARRLWHRPDAMGMARIGCAASIATSAGAAVGRSIAPHSAARTARPTNAGGIIAVRLAGLPLTPPRRPAVSH
jgi:hypothetical protein